MRNIVQVLCYTSFNFVLITVSIRSTLAHTDWENSTYPRILLFQKASKQDTQYNACWERREFWQQLAFTRQVFITMCNQSGTWQTISIPALTEEIKASIYIKVKSKFKHLQYPVPSKSPLTQHALQGTFPTNSSSNRETTFIVIFTLHTPQPKAYKSIKEPSSKRMRATDIAPLQHTEIFDSGCKLYRPNIRLPTLDTKAQQKANIPSPRLNQAWA